MEKYILHFINRLTLIALSNQNRQRAVYEDLKLRIEKKKKAVGLEANDIIVNPSFLRMSSLLGNQGTVTFVPIESKVNAPFVTDRRLVFNDVFVITDMAFYLSKGAANDATWNPFYTWPNPKIFNGAAPVEFDELLKFYAGSFNFMVNTTEWIKSDRVNKSYVQPNQQGLVEYVNAQPTTQRNADTKAAKDGYFEQTPNIEFAGSDDVKCTVDLNQTANMAGQGGTFNFATLECEGFRISNGQKLFTSEERK
jgi:hypothetical protein